MIRYPLFFMFGKKRFFIHRRVLRYWESAKQLKQTDTEQFGVMIGHKNERDIYVDFITQPFSEDISTRASFILRDSRHQYIVSKAFDRSNGKLGYIGTWHTHPEDFPTPSTIDTTDWDKCLQRNKDRDLYFIIVGRKNIYLFYKYQNKYLKIEGEIND